VESKVVVIDDKDWVTRDRKIPKKTARLLPRASDRDADGVKNTQDRCPKTPAETEVDKSGCAILIHQVLSIKFATNRAVIQDRYAAEIDKLAQEIKTFGRVHIKVEAYSDRSDQEMDSQLLSELRAAVIADLLIIKTGIPNEGFTMIGHTEGNSGDGQANQNHQSRQRVVITVSKR
jgi:OOP family OmpA-OmpF porin